jgi:hypothetical protein
MKRSAIYGLLAVSCLLAASPAIAGTSIAVQFLGRDGSGDVSGNPGVPPIAPTDVVGVVPQSFWNPIDNQYGYTDANKGATQPGQLLDNNGQSTTVTLTFDCNDSWYNDVTPTNLTTPTARMMNGIIKVSSGGGVPGTFTFTGVPEGQYDLYVYTCMNGDNVKAKYSDSDFSTSYYVTLQHQFYDTNVFVQGTNTDPAGTTNLCNYVKFSNLGTYGRGRLGVVAQWVANSDGLGVSGLQLVNIGPPAVNGTPVAISKQPASRRVVVGDTNVTFTVATTGPVFSYQWLKNGSPVPGETNATILVPAITSGDNGVAYSVVVSNNVNQATSTGAVITVGQLVQVAGVQEKLWSGADRAGIESGSFDSTVPDKLLALGLFETPTAQGNTYGERVDCLFKPAVTTNYTFFITADDDADLFISQNSGTNNLQLIAQEVSWSNPRTWVSNDGGTGNRDVQQKRSDQYSPDAGTTMPYSNGIPLVAGNTYYLEAVHHEGGGGDFVDVTFKIAGEPDPKNGDASRITAFTTAPWPKGLDGAYIVVTNPPQNVIGNQSRTATLTVGATAGYVGDTSGLAPSLAYQWQSAPAGSSSFVNIPGANGTSYTTPILKLSDNNTQYRVTIAGGDALTNSSIGTLTISPDTTAPLPVEVTAVSADGKTVSFTFNELMDKASVEDASGYVINPGSITATAASLASDGITVTLTTGTAATSGVTNVVTITKAKDLAGNLPASGTTISFIYNLVTYQAGILFDKPVAYYRLDEVAGATVATNLGTIPGDGVYYTGDETSPGSGGVAVTNAVGDPGPRPPDFKGFAADNRAATFGGPDTAQWIDTKKQFLQHRRAFSLEYWVAPTNRASWGNRIGIVGENDVVEYGFINPNTIEMWTPGGGAIDTAWPTNFVDGDWHHVATIADGTNIKNYYDGVLVDTGGSATTDYGNAAYFCHIGGGGITDGTGNYFEGRLDEIAIFTNAIPAARIAAHYSAGKNGGVLVQSGTVTPALPGNKPVLTFSKSGNTLSISWSPAGGTLQTTTSLSGATINWTDVGSANPTQINVGPGNAYYRVKQ